MASAQSSTVTGRALSAEPRYTERIRRHVASIQSGQQRPRPARRSRCAPPSGRATRRAPRGRSADSRPAAARSRPGAPRSGADAGQPRRAIGHRDREAGGERRHGEEPGRRAQILGERNGVAAPTFARVTARTPSRIAASIRSWVSPSSCGWARPNAIAVDSRSARLDARSIRRATRLVIERAGRADHGTDHDQRARPRSACTTAGRPRDHLDR